MPDDGDVIPQDTTAWGVVPSTTPLIDAFSGTDFQAQDIGLDGISDSTEQVMFGPWIDEVRAAFTIPRNAEIATDPSGDNFTFFNDPSLTGDDLIERYRNNNSPENNSPDISSNSTNNFQRGNPIPDKEDLNNNRSLDQRESYFEYKIPIHNDGTGFVEPNIYITNTRVVQSPDRPDETWYRYRIPLSKPTAKIGEIEGFRSIQFIRLLLEEFSTQKTFRLADFELVRNQWRRQPVICLLYTSPSPRDS